MTLPRWFAQLTWDGPHTVQQVNGDRDVIPSFPGVYVFTSTQALPRPTQTLYVGQAKNLRQRIPSYLVDYTRPKQREGHKGKGFLLEYRHDHGDHALYVRWAEYGGRLYTLEASLINYLNPAFNTREEDALHPLLDDNELLDSRLIR